MEGCNEPDRRPILGVEAVAVLEALVVIALIGTVAALLAGIVAMARGGDFNRKWGNQLMRARVAMQALAVGLMFVLYLLHQGGE